MRARTGTDRRNASRRQWEGTAGERRETTIKGADSSSVSLTQTQGLAHLAILSARAQGMSDEQIRETFGGDDPAADHLYELGLSRIGVQISAPAVKVEILRLLTQ